MNAYCQTLLLFLLFQFIPVIKASFGADFRNFVHNRYGPDMVHLLERMDLGKEGSIGGSEAGESRYNGQPVIVVHGITNKISRFYVS